MSDASSDAPSDSFFKNGKNRADTQNEHYFNQAKISDQTSEKDRKRLCFCYLRNFMIHTSF